MPPLNSPLFFSSLLTLILSISVQTYSQNDENNRPFLNYCYGDSYNLSTPYDSNLRLLLANLISSTPKSPSFFSQINSTSPQIFGLAQCIPDITPSICSACLNRSAVAFTNNPGCVRKKSFANRARNCLIRYSDQLFYNVPVEGLYVFSTQVQNASASFNGQANSLMKSVIESAAAAVLRYAVGATNESVVDGRDIYGMGWCSMDLASSDCAQCLTMVLDRIAGKNRGEAAYVSCELRYETFQFYSNSTIAPAPAPAPAPRSAAIAPAIEGGKRRTHKTIAISAGTSGAVALLIFLTVLILLLQRRKIKLTESDIRYFADEEVLKILEVEIFDFCAIKNATNNFAVENKLGQGGFGPVYKGMLINGQEVAVKRLSKTSGQGLEEMKNEINFTAKLQHKNLVRLLGYCLEQEEKLLVYEFLPNTSLDKFLFDPIRKAQLNWETRFKIIVGIGRGLLYLHEDSHLRIVHRDLKASNILLDSNMNPKISDFGVAKLFGVDETERNTCRIYGTCGYMAPEYALHGLFSIKSDVFSYGVLVLEIITGEKSIEGSEQFFDLLSYVWKHWNQRKEWQVIDRSIGERNSAQEALRCLQIGLLCVQEDQIQRPDMSFVIVMLSTPSMKLPIPTAPTFYREKGISVHSELVTRRRYFGVSESQ